MLSTAQMIVGYSQLDAILERVEKNIIIVESNMFQEILIRIALLLMGTLLALYLMYLGWFLSEVLF